MNSVHLMRVAGLRPFAAFLQRIGAPVPRLLAGTGLPVHVLDDAEALIPVCQAFRFMEDSARAEGIENLGILVGQSTILDQLGVFGRLIRRSRTLHDAVGTMLRAVRAFTSAEGYWLTESGGELQLCHTFTADLPGRCQQADQFALMLSLALLRLAAGPEWRPAEVRLQTILPDSLRTVDCLSGARIVFAQSDTAVTFPRTLLLRPLPPAPRGDVHVHELEAWTASAPAKDFPSSVQQLVETLSSAEYPTIRVAAHVIGMSVRTLQRRLDASGVNYESLVARMRFARAVNLLARTNAKILDIAFDLGYQDHAHFSRAFRRWTGSSPREFRRASRGTRAEMVYAGR